MLILLGVLEVLFQGFFIVRHALCSHWSTRKGSYDVWHFDDPRPDNLGHITQRPWRENES